MAGVGSQVAKDGSDRFVGAVVHTVGGGEQNTGAGCHGQDCEGGSKGQPEDGIHGSCGLKLFGSDVRSLTVGLLDLPLFAETLVIGEEG